MESTRLPEHGSCFVCGSENRKGMGLVWYAQPHPEYNLLVFADFQFSQAEQGPPGYAHGGATAAVIDEVMGAVVWRSGLKVVLGNLNVNYYKPVPLNVLLRAEGWVEKTSGKLAHAFGQILLNDGTKLAAGIGMYVHAPQLFSFDYYS